MEDEVLRMSKKEEAHLLMKEFIMRETDDVAFALESFITIKDDLNYEALQRDMSIINQTFAALALQLIKYNSRLEDGDPNNIILPVDAKEMNHTLEEMSRLVQCLRWLFFYLLDRHRNDTAIVKAFEANWKFETQLV